MFFFIVLHSLLFAGVFNTNTVSLVGLQSPPAIRRWRGIFWQGPWLGDQNQTWPHHLSYTHTQPNIFHIVANQFFCIAFTVQPPWVGGCIVGEEGDGDFDFFLGWVVCFFLFSSGRTSAGAFLHFRSRHSVCTDPAANLVIWLACLLTYRPHNSQPEDKNLDTLTLINMAVGIYGSHFFSHFWAFISGNHG